VLFRHTTITHMCGTHKYKTFLLKKIFFIWLSIQLNFDMVGTLLLTRYNRYMVNIVITISHKVTHDGTLQNAHHYKNKILVIYLRALQQMGHLLKLYFHNYITYCNFDGQNVFCCLNKIMFWLETVKYTKKKNDKIIILTFV